MSKGLRVNHLSKYIIIRSYGELWFKAYVLLLDIIERVMVLKGKSFWTMSFIKRRHEKLRLKS